jgi:hypothetical protein
MLFNIIKNFIAQKDISPDRWELTITMRPSMIRGSLAPAAYSHAALKNIQLFRMPDVQDEPLDDVSYQVYAEELENDRRSIITSLKDPGVDAQRIATDYFKAATERLKVLALPKRALMERALASPDFANTGVCGETANLLARVLGADPVDEGHMETLINALRWEALPKIHLLVSIGDSHKFLVMKNGKDITLLQSWIGRFSLATWMDTGKVFWNVDEFANALLKALPNEHSDRINDSYNLLFNVRDGERTPSPHIASEVSCAVYMTPEDESLVQDNLRREYEAGRQKWES